MAMFGSNAEGDVVDADAPIEATSAPLITALTRGVGLPPDGSQDHYFAFDQGGNVWALQWSKDHECYSAVGWDGAWPATKLLRGEARDAIASYIEKPVRLVDVA